MNWTNTEKNNEAQREKLIILQENHTNAANLTYHTIKVNEDNNDAAIETARANEGINANVKPKLINNTDPTHALMHMAAVFLFIFHMKIAIPNSSVSMEQGV